MSQGQRKKVAITLALAAHTPLLLMDEPTNGLDIPSKATFRRLVASLIDDNQTVIISTHQVRDLESLIDTVLILDQRQTLLNKTLNEIGEKLYFGPLLPEESSLFRAYPARDNRRHRTGGQGRDSRILRVAL